MLGNDARSPLMCATTQRGLDLYVLELHRQSDHCRSEVQEDFAVKVKALPLERICVLLLSDEFPVVTITVVLL